MLRLPLVALLAVAAALPAAAQTVRFQTSVGAFDMLLNPTNNPNLQGHVDNLLANVAAGVYHRAVVNRAVTGFVLQIGSFQTESVSLSQTPTDGFAATNAFSPVVVDANNDGQVDFSTAGLTNSRGTVTLALSAGNANSGSASFFVNLTANTFLDAQDFIPFATIADLSTVDRIMNQTIIDLSADVGQNGSLAYTDVPLADDGDLIVIESATVISGDNRVFVGPVRRAFGLDPAAATVPTPTNPAPTPPPINDPLANFTPDELARLTDAQISGLLNGTLTEAQVRATLGGSAGSFAAASASAGAVGVPEPAAALLLGIASLAGMMRPR